MIVKKLILRCLRILLLLLLSLLVLIVLWVIYDTLREREEMDMGFSPRLASAFSTYDILFTSYLQNTPNPSQGVNLYENFKAYASDYDSDHDTDFIEVWLKPKEGICAFYVSGDIAWMGIELPKIFWTKGNNCTREKIRLSGERSGAQGRPVYYGSSSLYSPPPDTSAQYHYKQDDVVWRRPQYRMK
jgi:hypothetical protein